MISFYYVCSIEITETESLKKLRNRAIHNNFSRTLIGISNIYRFCLQLFSYYQIKLCLECEDMDLLTEGYEYLLRQLPEGEACSDPFVEPRQISSDPVMTMKSNRQSDSIDSNYDVGKTSNKMAAGANAVGRRRPTFEWTPHRLSGEFDQILCTEQSRYWTDEDDTRTFDVDRLTMADGRKDGKILKTYSFITRRSHEISLFFFIRNLSAFPQNYNKTSKMTF